MKALAFFGICLLVGCTAIDAAPPVLEQEFKITFSHQATIKNEALTLVFKEVSGDSRCPKGVQCVWAGQATITIEASKDGVSPQSLSVTVPSSDSADYSGYSVTLLALEPYPVAGRQIRPQEYVATLVVTKQ